MNKHFLRGFIASFIVSAVLLCGLGAQTYTKLNSRVERFQGDPKYTAGQANATSAPMTAFIVRPVVNDADSTDVLPARNVQVNFDLLAEPVVSTNYTAAGKTMNGAQFAAMMREISLSEANRQGISP